MFLCPFYVVARKGKGLTRRRIGVIAVGVILLVFLTNAFITGGQNLNFADPFRGGLDFRDVELEYSLFALADVSKLTDFIPLTEDQIRDKKCFLKMHQSAELQGGNIIALDSGFQVFGALTPFQLLTNQGATIEQFRDIELRLRCDSIPNNTGGQYEFEVVPRAGNPLFVTIRGYNQQGQLVELKGIDLKPKFEIGGFAYFTNDQKNFVVNPDTRIKFANEPSVQDPLKPAGTGLFTTSERTISKPVRISAIDLENAIESSTVLAPKTFTTEIRFNIHGAFDIDFPTLRDEGVLEPRQIPVDVFLLENRMTVQVTEFSQTGGFNLFPDKKTEITKIEPLNSEGRFSTDGSITNKNMKVFVTLDEYDRNVEGSVRGTIIRTFDQTGTAIATTGLGCGFPVSLNGIQSNFVCNFNIIQNALVGDYTISIKTSSTDRIVGNKSFLLVREGAPVGGTDGCPSGYQRDISGACVLFGTTGGGGGLFSCPIGQFKNQFGQCVVPTGGTGGTEVDPCPTQGETRNEFGQCVLILGQGGVGTKSCMDCQMSVIRVIANDDICPVFTCEGGGTTEGTEIENCEDGKPADIIAGEQTCNRTIGLFGGLLPRFVDCEAENRQANPERGEICVPSFLFALGNNIVAIMIGIIILIVVIVIISAIVKRSPYGRVYGALRR